jgi:hypothetical protein
MDAAWFHRLHWRHRGAWMWPAFLAATAADAVIGQLLPPSGESQGVIGAGLIACCLNLLGIVLLSRPFGALLRRRRGDLPAIIAHDYGGTTAIMAISVALLVAGLIHHSSVSEHAQAERDAVVRAQAFIGDHAPAEFRRDLTRVDVYAIEPGAMYRVCVPGQGSSRTFCVVVKSRMPFGQSVSFDGYEPNDVFAAGTR